MYKYRYVENPEFDAVSLRLFFDRQGVARAEVVGPVSETALGDRAPIDRCLVDPTTAFAAAIRIANRNDVEMVVLGDTSLWDPKWGTLLAG